MAAALTTLGRYELGRVLGQGNMGIVYEALDTRLRRTVAIKTIIKSRLDEDAARLYSARFLREAEALAQLNHPNIVQVYDFGEEGDVAYIVMEFLKNGDLKDKIDETEKFAVKDVVRIMTELLDALNFAHEKGVVHRDIKPANVMFDSHGRVKLADFGVARVENLDSTQSERTQVGFQPGTPAYMSPEQIQSDKFKQIDGRTDIFSTGVILYQLLTGERPFQGQGIYTIQKKIVSEEPRSPSTLRTEISPAYDRVVSKALAKDRENRFRTGQEFKHALQQAFEQAPLSTEDVTLLNSPSAYVPAVDPKPVSAKATTTVSTQTQELELEFWRAIKDSDDPEDYESYVEQFSQGTYVSLAQRKAARLRRGTTPGEKSGSVPSPGSQANPVAHEPAREEAEKARTQAELKKRQEEEEQAKKRDAQEQAKRADEQRARAEFAKVKQDSEARARKEYEEQRREAEERARKEVERVKRETEERVVREAEAQARAAAEKAKREAQERAEAEKAIREAHERTAAEKAKREAQERAAAEEKARKHEEQAKREKAELARRQAEEKARLDAEELARAQAAELARRRAEEQKKQEAEDRARKEQEILARRRADELAKREAEAKAKREEELRAKREAEEKTKQDEEQRSRAAALRAKRDAEEQQKTQRETDNRQRKPDEERLFNDADQTISKAPNTPKAQDLSPALPRSREEAEIPPSVPNRPAQSRGLMIGVAVAAVAIIGGGVVYFNSRTVSQPTVATAPSTSPTAPVPATPPTPAVEVAPPAPRPAEPSLETKDPRAEDARRAAEAAKAKQDADAARNKDDKKAVDKKIADQKLKEEADRKLAEEQRQRDLAMKATADAAAKATADAAAKATADAAAKATADAAAKATADAAAKVKEAIAAKVREAEIAAAKAKEADLLKIKEAEIAKAKVNPDVLFQQGVALLGQNRPTEAVRAFRAAALAGHGPAAKRLGEIYDRGQGDVGRDYQESLRFYNLAGKLGQTVPIVTGRQ